MKKIVLDTNILLNYPEVLSTKRQDAQLIIPDHVLSELLRHRNNRFKDINNLIQNAQEKGYVTITSTAVPREPLVGRTAVGFVDYTILGYAKFLKENAERDEVILATDDRKFAELAVANGVKVYSSNELIAFYSTSVTTKDQEIKDEAKEIENKERWGILANLFFAILIVALIVLFARYYASIIDKLKNVALIIILVIFGFLLFEIREKRRQLYGFVEVGFGILTIVIVFYPDIILSNWEQFLKIGAGLYVIVRGLDNLYKGSENRKLGPLLKRLFRFK